MFEKGKKFLKDNKNAIIITGISAVYLASLYPTYKRGFADGLKLGIDNGMARGFAGALNWVDKQSPENEIWKRWIDWSRENPDNIVVY